MKCPLCKTESKKALYMGLPVKFCDAPGCHCLWGFWSFIPTHFQAEDGGWSFVFYDGSYWQALWHWLKG